MSDFTPTTEQVRMSFVTDDHDRYTDPGPEFDRWLAAHDREVAARTLRDSVALFADELDPAGSSILLGHADRIETGELDA